MTESLWLDLACWTLKIVGRAAFLTALVGFLAIFLNIGGGLRLTGTSPP